jgi:nucleoside-diphosphate-sugar epimerase
MKTLVTGGAGYVGNLLCKSLLEAGHEVTAMDNFLYGYESILNLVPYEKFHVLKQDIRTNDPSYLKGMDVVFHLAGLSGYPACESNPNSARLINVDATRHLSDSLDPAQILVFASTTSLYENAGAVCNEETKLNPRGGLYSITKYAAERYVMERANSISLRWATVFGVSARMRAGLILNDFVEKDVHEGTLVLYSAVSKRTFMHVRDSVRGYMFALDNIDKMRGGIYNMGSERLNYSKLELANAVKRHVKFEVIESELGDKDVRNFIISFDKARALGFDCEISIDQGIAELVKLYRFYDPNSFVRPI